MSFFVNRSPTQHASTIDYNRLRITQRLPVPPVMQPFFSSSSFGRRGSQGTRTPAPDALGSVARSLLPPPCKPWPPEDLSGRVQATARRKSQIPARRRRERGRGASAPSVFIYRTLERRLRGFARHPPRLLAYLVLTPTLNSLLILK